MDNFVLTTLVALLLAVPGYFARALYFSEDFSRDVLPKSVTEEIYLSLLFSIPFHAVALWIIDQWYISGSTSIYVDYGMVFGLLTGKSSPDVGETISAADNLYRYFGPIVGYFVGTAILAAIVGFGFRRVVWRFKLDVHLPSLFRYRNRWLYTFTGREWEGSKENVYVVVDAMCLLGGEKTRLYRGLVFGFDSDSNGDLEQIRLGLAYRGKFDESNNEFYWQEVPGSILVLKYDTIQSLNVTYIARSDFNPNFPSFRNPASPGPNNPDQQNDSSGGSALPAAPAPS